MDRDTAARFGISAATIDNALYDSFGQRIISTIFTESTQYRVIMEADPKLQNTVASLDTIYLPSSQGGQVPLSAIAHVDPAHGAAADQSSQSISVRDHLVRRRKRLFAGLRRQRVKDAEAAAGLPSGITSQFEGSAGPLSRMLWATRFF